MFEKIKDIIRSINNRISKSPLSALFYVVLDSFMLTEYHLLNVIYWIKGKRKPSKIKQQLVKEKVTFIFKSFERQKMAKRLYRNIQKYYPGVKVIISDDSKKPFDLKDEYLEVIQLPFNSGLSYGIIRALERVETPYVIRMDDDELLTLLTQFDKQLDFLTNHPEVDLVSVLVCSAPLCLGPKHESKKYYSQSMSYAPLPLKIQHKTRLDKDHLVMGKTPNVFIARTEKIKEIGYDKNIRMIDHNEFFYRAAGRLVSTMDECASVFHYHNPYDAFYNRYRSDYMGDIIYIRKKHNRRNKQTIRVNK